jgi:isopenicillin-N epimerase
MTSPHAHHWPLDPEVTFLNHGSFGACPKPVLEAQSRLREQAEREPVRFFTRELPPLLDGARAALATIVGADADDLAFVNNATAGVNTILRSLDFAPGDELLVTDQVYGACRNAVDFVAAKAGAVVRVAKVPFPFSEAAEIVEAIVSAAGPKTRLALIDHVTSPTGVVWPIAEIVKALAERGIDTLVDGAHTAGMVKLDVGAIGAAYYTGNCHKWLCTPKGSAFLHVRRDRQERVRPLVISHGATAKERRFRAEFDWTGTDDPTPFLCIPEAIRFLSSLVPGGFDGLLAHNRAGALDTRGRLCAGLGVEPPCPAEFLGSLAAVPVPDCDDPNGPFLDPLGAELYDRYRIEVPVFAWPRAPKRLVRVSFQAYNSAGQYERLITALRELLF